MKWIFGLAAILIVAIGLLLAHDLGFRPASWDAVHLGDTYDSVKDKFPQLVTTEHDLKHVDFLYEKRATGCWLTIYGWNEEGTLKARTVKYLLGTSRHFKVVRPAVDGVANGQFIQH